MALRPDFDPTGRSAVDPRKIYTQMMGDPTKDQQNYNSTYAAPNVTVPVDDVPSGVPPSNQPGGGTGTADLWKTFLSKIGASAGTGEGSGSWGQQPDGDWYRSGTKGWDLFGLAPQTIYWQNMQGAGFNPDPSNLRTADFLYGDKTYGTTPAGASPYGDWFRKQMDDLKSVWGQFDSSQQAAFRNRLLQGTGLPDYLQAFQRARPQWMTDYIKSNFG